MTLMQHVFTQPLFQALGWALVHFLWQGALAALVLACCNLSLSRSPARVRYAVNCLFLLVLLALPLLTFEISFTPFQADYAATRFAAAPSRTSILVSTGEAPLGGAPDASLHDPIAPALPWIIALWISGVVLLSIRWTVAWVSLRRFRRAVSLPVPLEWNRTLQHLKQRLAVSLPVRFCISRLAQAPSVIGWLRPVILMPAAAIAGLDAQVLEAVLAHELAHIRRHDYLVNLLQTLVETLLFYHPAVWWVSKQIRVERENCCDDIAAELCGNRVIYARALVDLEQSRSSVASFALAANGGSLMHRVQRLLRSAEPDQRLAPTWLSALAGIAIVACALVGTRNAVRASSPAAQAGTNSAQAQAPAPSAPAAAQAPKRPRPASTKTASTTSPAPRLATSAPPTAEMKTAGYGGLSAEQLQRLRIHGVDSDFVQGMKAHGLGDLSMDDLVSLRIHGVTPEFIDEMKSAGYGGLSAKQYQELRIYGVDAAFIRHLNETGLHKLSLQQLIRLRQAGI